jgi:hypothetical protein
MSFQKRGKEQRWIIGVVARFTIRNWALVLGAAEVLGIDKQFSYPLSIAHYPLLRLRSVQVPIAHYPLPKKQCLQGNTA